MGSEGLLSQPAPILSCHALHPVLTRLSAMSDLQLFSTRRPIPDRGGGLRRFADTMAPRYRTCCSPSLPSALPVRRNIVQSPIGTAPKDL
jgi:hypothetical protein